MNYLLKLLIPLALGVIAAGINYNLLSANTKPSEFVTVAQPLQVGEQFVLENAKKLLLPKKYEELSKTLVPWRDRGVLSGRVVRRNIAEDDPVFFADTDLGGEWLTLRANEELFPVELDNVAVDAQLLRIGNDIRFRVPATDGESEPPWVGPFRIVAVGAKINNNFSEGRSFSTGTKLSVGIAYDMQGNAEQLKRLEKFCDAQSVGSAQMLGVRIDDRRRK